MKRNNFLKILLIINSLTLLTSCSEIRNDDFTQSSSQSEYFSEINKFDTNTESDFENSTTVQNDYKLIDGIWFHNQLIENETSTSFNMYTAIDDEYNLDLLKQLFEQNPLVEEITHGNDITYKLTSQDGAIGLLDNSCAFYYSVDGIISVSIAQTVTTDDLLSNELSFCSKEDAVKKSIAKLKDMGIENEMYTNKIIPVDKEYYSDYIDRITNNLDLTDEKEAAIAAQYKNAISHDFYYISFYLDLNGVPILTDDELYYSQFQSMVYGSTIEVCYSNNGIESLYISSTAHIDDDCKNEVSYSDAYSTLPLISNKINQGIIKETPFVDKVERVYLICKENNTKFIVPCWKFSVFFEHLNSYQYYYFKATDGSEVF